MPNEMEAARLERLRCHMQKCQPLLMLSLIRDLRAEGISLAGVELPMPNGSRVQIERCRSPSDDPDEPAQPEER